MFHGIRFCLPTELTYTSQLAALFGHVLAAEREQNDIDQSLDHIEQQQKDLSATLDAYEKSTEEILGGQGGSLRALDTGPADNERDKKYVDSLFPFRDMQS
jgi:nuclear pore complex protein Nup62